MNQATWQKLAETIDEIGAEMNQSMEENFTKIETIKDPDQKKYVSDVYHRTKEAIKNKDGKSANGLIIELKEFLKHGC